MFGIYRRPTCPPKLTRRREPPPRRYAPPKYLAVRIDDLEGFRFGWDGRLYRWPRPVPDAVPAYSDPILAARQLGPGAQLLVMGGEKAFTRNRFAAIDRENLNFLCADGFRAARVVAGQKAIEAVLRRHARRVCPGAGLPRRFEWAFGVGFHTACEAADVCTRAAERFFSPRRAVEPPRLSRGMAAELGRALLDDLHATVRAAPPGPDWMVLPERSGRILLRCPPVESLVMDFTEMVRTWAPAPGPMGILRVHFMCNGYWTLRVNHENREAFLETALELIADKSIRRSRVRYAAQARSGDRVFDLEPPTSYWTLGT